MKAKADVVRLVLVVMVGSLVLLCRADTNRSAMTDDAEDDEFAMQIAKWCSKVFFQSRKQSKVRREKASPTNADHPLSLSTSQQLNASQHK